MEDCTLDFQLPVLLYSIFEHSNRQLNLQSNDLVIDMSVYYLDYKRMYWYSCHGHNDTGYAIETLYLDTPLRAVGTVIYKI